MLADLLPQRGHRAVKRMAASFTIAARHNGFSKADTRAATQASVTAYREAMATFAAMGTLEIWYAHLSNFGMFASPERRLLFDLNDFDETLPGPFEYDVKRMAASFTIAGRNNGFGKADIKAATLA